MASKLENGAGERSPGLSPADSRFVDEKKIRDAPMGGATLLDLGDDLLLNILFLLHEAPAIVSLGAVNRRLNRLHFSVGRIRAAIGPNKKFEEDRLYTLLHAVAHKGGGLLQQLSLSIIDRKEPLREYYLQEFPRISLVSASLRSLELKLSLFGDSTKVFNELLTCTNLVNLNLSMGQHAFVKGEHLLNLLTSCSHLKTLIIDEGIYIDKYEREVELASGSLEILTLLMLTCSVPSRDERFILKTSALTHFTTSLIIKSLDLRSHSLKSISMKSLGELSSTTLMANLEMLSTGKYWSFEAAERALGSITSSRLGRFRVSDKVVPVSKLAGIIPRHLRELNQLTIVLEDDVPGLDDAPVKSQASLLRIERVAVMVVRKHDESESDQYESTTRWCCCGGASL